MGQGILLSADSGVDFMIHGVFSYNLFGQKVWITTSHICLLIVVCVLVLAFIAGGMVFRRAKAIPGPLQCALEMAVAFTVMLRITTE